ncbi:MAG: hypothetical protein ABW328_15705, partial [Ilumatobacteraceae bacterium]
LGGVFWGFDPLVSLSGTEISMGRSLLLLGGATLAYALPTFGVASRCTARGRPARRLSWWPVSREAWSACRRRPSQEQHARTARP